MDPTSGTEQGAARFFARLKLLFTDPRHYWTVRHGEPGDLRAVAMPDVVIMAGVPALGVFWGTILAGLLPSLRSGHLLGLLLGAVLSLLVGYVLNLALWAGTALVIALLSDAFGAQRDDAAARKLATGLLIPTWIGAVLSVTTVRAVGMVGALAGLGYGAYVMSLGLSVLLPVAREKRLVFVATVVGVLLMGTLLTMLLAGAPASRLAR